MERKSLADLVTSLTTGKLKFQLTQLAAIPRAAVVVRGLLAGLQSSTTSDPASWQMASPNARSGSRECRSSSARPRKLAQEWTYRFLAAAPASAHDIVVSDRGGIPVAVMDQYIEARARGDT